MHIRSFIAACALALASMLAFPAMALDATPANALTFDQIGHDLIVAPVFGFAHVDAIALDVLDMASIVSTGAADKVAGCFAENAMTAADMLGGSAVESATACARRYDPGWRFS